MAPKGEQKKNAGNKLQAACDTCAVVLFLFVVLFVGIKKSGIELLITNRLLKAKERKTNQTTSQIGL